MRAYHCFVIAPRFVLKSHNNLFGVNYGFYLTELATEILSSSGRGAVKGVLVTVTGGMSTSGSLSSRPLTSGEDTSPFSAWEMSLGSSTVRPSGKSKFNESRLLIYVMASDHSQTKNI